MPSSLFDVPSLARRRPSLAHRGSQAMTDDAKPFSLEAHEVPRPARSAIWADHLRWAVAVMDGDDSDLAFVASLLSHAVRHDGLSPRQAKYARRILDRLIAAWRENR